MKKTISILMVLAVSTFIVLAAKETISVKGSAEISAKPDVAYFTITSTFTEDTTEEARNKTSDMIANCVELLEED